MLIAKREVRMKVTVTTGCVRAYLVPLHCQLSVYPLVIWHFYHSGHEFLSLWSPFKLSKGAQFYGCKCASRSHIAPALSLVLADTFHMWAHNGSEQPRNWSTEPSVSHIPRAHRRLAASLLLPCQSHIMQLPTLLTPAIQKLSYLTCVSLASHCRVLAKSTAWEKASLLIGNSCRKKWNSSTRPSPLNRFYANVTFHSL